MKFRVEIEVLENGYTVSIPDIDAYNKAEAEFKKAKKPSGMGMDMGSPYMGDYEKEYMAKTVDEVIALITPALKKLPQATFDEAFAEAADMADKDD